MASCTEVQYHDQLYWVSAPLEATLRCSTMTSNSNHDQRHKETAPWPLIVRYTTMTCGTEVQHKHHDHYWYWQLRYKIMTLNNELQNVDHDNQGLWGTIPWPGIVRYNTMTRDSEVQYHNQEYKGKNPRPPILLWYQTKPTMSITIFLRVCFCFLVRFTKISQSGFCSSLKATARWWFSSTDSSLYIRASSEPKHETMNTWWTGSHYCWPWWWYVWYSLHIARVTPVLFAKVYTI